MIRVLFGAAFAVVLAGAASPAHSHARTIAVSGRGIDHVDTALVHSRQTTPEGTVQISTETVDVSGDLTGRVLYQVTSVVDDARGTLTNTGNQVFSGTVAGTGPVMLHDDQFRFDVDLKSGKERGRVFLAGWIAGPRAECTLDVAGAGADAGGNPAFTYSGACTIEDR